MRHNAAREHSAGALPSPDRIAELLDRWRTDAEALRRRGGDSQAGVLDTCSAELTEALAGNGVLSAPPSERQKPSEPDRLLTVEETAARLGVTRAWIYGHWRERLPFGKRLSHRQLRFGERALARYLAGTNRGTAA